MATLPKILVIVGPTASGKSDLAVRLAKRCNGEVVSADSRQVYTGLDIGTGKITRAEMRGVPHHLLDVASPRLKYTVAKYQRDASKTIQEILKRGKLPIICGGTGFYVDALVNGVILPDVPPNNVLRKRLEKIGAKNPERLSAMLEKIDPSRASTVDPKNLRRVIRAIEIAKALGKVPAIARTTTEKYDAAWLGTKVEPEILRQKIAFRLKVRLKKGMVREAERLHAGTHPKMAGKLSWRRMEELGLEYRYLALFLQGKLTRADMTTKLETEIWHYAKRQIAWFKREKKIEWVEPQSKSLGNYVEKLLK